jgi:hypothetical protein
MVCDRLIARNFWGQKSGLVVICDLSAADNLKRIKPVVEKINSHIGCGLQRIRLHGSARHGVVSSPTLQRQMIRG